MPRHKFCLDEILPPEDHGPSSKKDQKPEAGELDIVSK